MQTLTLKIEDIQALNQVKQKLLASELLTQEERYLLADFISNLPPPETLLSEQFPPADTFEIKIFDMQTMWPLLENWVMLFERLPKIKNGNSSYPKACAIYHEDYEDPWSPNMVIIEVVFIPSLYYSKRKEGENKTIILQLKIDGTAKFQFWFVEDAENFPKLYSFKGSWKESYLLTVKTLQQGWPQITFPKEFEQFL